MSKTIGLLFISTLLDSYQNEKENLRQLYLSATTVSYSNDNILLLTVFHILFRREFDKQDIIHIVQ